LAHNRLYANNNKLCPSLLLVLILALFICKSLLYAVLVLGDYFLQRIIYVFFAANGLKNILLKFPVNNKIYFPIFALFIYILYNNIIDHEIMNIYDI